MGGVGNTIRDSVLFTTADSVISWSRRSALWPETFGIACCAIEMISAGCARYDLDRRKGTFARPAHQLFGQSYHDKILVLVTAKGGVASAWMLREMKERGIVPKALVFDRTNTILAQGAAFAVFEGDVDD